jgi:hypothetical protein
MESEIRILQKGLRPFIFRGIVYFPVFLVLLNSTDQVVDGKATLEAGDYRCDIELPVLKRVTRRGVIKSFRVLRIPLSQLGEGVNTRIACAKVVPGRDAERERDAGGGGDTDDERSRGNASDSSGDNAGDGNASDSGGEALLMRRLGWRQRRRDSHPKLYYAPFSVRRDFKHGRCVHLRRTGTGRLVIVRRSLESIERTLRFRFLESRFFSLLFSVAARVVNAFTHRKTIVFYEKFAEKAEEGVFELFQKVQGLSGCRPYFVIDSASSDFDRIQSVGGPGVVAKFSLRYYWLLYRATVFIGTEIPTHLNILRSNNASLRRHLYRGMFVFLQHGITYLKSQSLTSSYVEGREGEADYITVSGEKERDVIVRDLRYDQKRALITGLAQFSLLEYQHIDDGADDVVTIMLTWKPYDEILGDPSASAYYQNLLQTVETVGNQVPRENLRVIAHPKTAWALAKTSLGASLWRRPINEALQSTKLLITDYSSVCYNVFYQGGGVIFYQPDLERYEQEVGPLIPSDDEYIGMRTFSTAELRHALTKAIDQEGRVVLASVRTAHYERNNAAINPYHDGKNIDRVFCALRDAGILGADGGGDDDGVNDGGESGNGNNGE